MMIVIITTIIVAVIAIALLTYFLLIKDEMDKITKAQYRNEVMTVWYQSGKVVEYEGSGTVWNKMPMMQRCGTMKEIKLCEIYKYIRKWGNDYPTAHLNLEHK